MLPDDIMFVLTLADLASPATEYAYFDDMTFDFALSNEYLAFIDTVLNNNIFS